jgi:peptidoglycan hydrolase-like protein with peptidoglycan-binding domain
MSLLPLPDDQDTGLPDFSLPDLDPFSLSGSVGRFGDNDRNDVIKAQVLFGNTGDYDLAALGAPTGWPGGELDQAMQRFQKDRGLTVDGIMLPGGETLQALQGELGNRLKGYAVPTPDVVDRFYDGRNSFGAEAKPLPAIVTAEQRDGHPLGVMRPAQQTVPQAASQVVMSDADDTPSAPLWRAGAQLAQAAPTVRAPSAPATKPAASVAAELPVVKTRVFSDKAIPLPASKTSTFDQPENKGAWDGFQAGLARQLPNSPVLRQAYSDIYAVEGGKLPDPNTGAVGGIMPGTLEDMRKRGKLPDLPADLKPADLNPAQQVEVMHAYVNDVMHTSGGAAALERLDPALALAVADTLYADGRSKGAEFLQKAVQKTGGQIEQDGKMGPQTFAAIVAMNGDPQARDRLLSALAEVRIGAKERLPGEITRINRLRPRSGN